jgi:ABC-type multidrug transport system, ATPase component
MVNIKSLSKSYGNKKVLTNLNLKLINGEVSGMVGENGAGKTTLFRCIAGMENYEGQIDSDVNKLKEQVGFLPTNPNFMSRITGWEYLKLLCVARKIKTENFEEQNIFDLPLSQYAATYSTGMKKKLALMGILLQKNEIYILDEPFNGVDIHSNMIISEIIKKLKARQKTILISSHIFSTLSDCCDNIHLLENGEISKVVTREGFSTLDQEMQSFVVGDKVDCLDI